MASERICSIPDCGKPVYNRGWCGGHFHRWHKYGDPLSGGTSKNAASAYYRDVVLNYDADECLVWPFGKTSGYGVLRVNGKNEVVSRLTCEAVKGPPPTDRHEAAHLCGNGAAGCVNPRHLTWKTPSENTADKLIHGTHNRGERYGLSKLTENDVRKIRTMIEQQMNDQGIAAKFGVSRWTIRAIRSGRTWAWLD